MKKLLKKLRKGIVYTGLMIPLICLSGEGEAREATVKGNVVTAVGCWSSAGSASDSEEFFLSHDMSIYAATGNAGLTDKERSQIRDACGMANYKPDDRCCRFTFEGEKYDGNKYKIRKFIKVEAL